MSTLSSTSTLAEIQAAYDDNASYLEDASVSKCKAFITSVRLLVRRTAAAVSSGVTGNSVQTDLSQYREELRDARRWLARNGGVAAGGAGVKNLSLENYR